MLRTALVALLVGAVLSGCGIRIVRYEFADDSVVAEKFTSVRVRNGAGDVSIRYVSGLTETKIHRRVEHTKDRKPEGPTHRMEGGNTLVLDECGHNCEVSYQVQVPDDKITVQGDTGSGDVVVEGIAAVDYKTGSGRIVVKDVKGDVRAITGSGDFEAARIDGSLTAETGSGRMRLDVIKGKTVVIARNGDISGSAIDNDVTVDAGSGDISLTFVSERAVRATTASGNVTVRIPGGPFKVSGESGSGERMIDVATDPAAKNELKVSTGSGDVRVLGV